MQKQAQAELQIKDKKSNVLGKKAFPSNLPTTAITPPAASISATPTILSRSNSIKIGIAHSDYANKRGELSKLQDSLGIKFSTISIFKQFGLPGNDMINPDDLSYIRNQGMKLMIAWEPWNPKEGLHQSKDYLADIAAGGQDAYIKRFAKEIKRYNAPVVMRFGHEMNGSWYPWGKRPTEYVTAYRRIFILFKDEGVQNISWMWSINNDPLPNISSYYPGDEYVDSIGIDGFNMGTTRADNKWTSFSQVFGNAYRFISNSYNKPIIISETASTEVGGDKAAWINDMFHELPLYMPKINELIWFNFNKESDWRIESTPTSFNSFKANH